MPRVREFPAADPAHPDHRDPVWGTEHVAAWFGVTRWAVGLWVTGGRLPQCRVERTATGRTRRLWRPADIVAVTRTRRVLAPAPAVRTR